jgi:flagellum-specific peptidoglycan hydrolase FlgJ
VNIIYLIALVLWLPDTYTEDSSVAAYNYIETYKDIAVLEMHRTGIPASITLAQALHESAKGTSSLATSANNHFGIKCKKYWKGSTYYHKDDDRNQQGVLIESCFRSYETVTDSYVDHSNFLKFRDNYQALFTLDKKDYRGWAYGLKRAGYATDPLYAEKLIKNIEEYNLTIYDVEENPYKKIRTLN